MTELRKRPKQEADEQSGTDQDEDDGQEVPGNIQEEKMNTSLPQDTGKTGTSIDDAISKIPQRWRNWTIRGMFSIVMICGFFGIIYLGPLALVTLVMLIQIKCFHEIISIGYIVYKSQKLPYFRTLSWYFLVTTNYFLYGESLIDRFGILLSRGDQFMQPFATYHRFISLCMYLAGFLGFVLSLVKKHYLRQFTLFGYTHVTLLLIVTQSHFIINNIFNGLIWFLLSTTLVICNDIWAYIFGFFFGKTPLIKLSPKKTWEGFIGGGFATIIYGILCAYALIRFDFFVCPISYSESQGISMQCERSHVFQVAHYNVPATVKSLFALVGVELTILKLYPFIFHTIMMACFASLIGPFGGFFASGFKRAFKIKDFGDSIPGHGGLMDRFDCQLLMGTFVYVYYITFLSPANPERLLKMVLQMKQEEQLEFFSLLQTALKGQGQL